jgi:hypothetical protein
MDGLREALEASRPRIEGALGDAERELIACRQRCAELESLIAVARSVAEATEHRPPAIPARPPTLYEAMSDVLSRSPAGLLPLEIASEINTRGLYRKRDGRQVDRAQVNTAVSNYSSRFTRRDGKIVLTGAS